MLSSTPIGRGFISQLTSPIKHCLDLDRSQTAWTSSLATPTALPFLENDCTRAIDPADEASNKKPRLASLTEENEMMTSPLLQEHNREARYNSAGGSVTCDCVPSMSLFNTASELQLSPVIHGLPPGEIVVDMPLRQMSQPAVPSDARFAFANQCVVEVEHRAASQPAVNSKKSSQTDLENSNVLRRCIMSPRFSMEDALSLLDTPVTSVRRRTAPTRRRKQRTPNNSQSPVSLCLLPTETSKRCSLTTDNLEILHANTDRTSKDNSNNAPKAFHCSQPCIKPALSGSQPMPALSSPLRLSMSESEHMPVLSPQGLSFHLQQDQQRVMSSTPILQSSYLSAQLLVGDDVQELGDLSSQQQSDGAGAGKGLSDFSQEEDRCSSKRLLNSPEPDSVLHKRSKRRREKRGNNSQLKTDETVCTIANNARNKVEMKSEMKTVITTGQSDCDAGATVTQQKVDYCNIDAEKEVLTSPTNCMPVVKIEMLDNTNWSSAGNSLDPAMLENLLEDSLHCDIKENGCDVDFKTNCYFVLDSHAEEPVECVRKSTENQRSSLHCEKQKLPKRKFVYPQRKSAGVEAVGHRDNDDYESIRMKLFEAPSGNVVIKNVEPAVVKKDTKTQVSCVNTRCREVKATNEVQKSVSIRPVTESKYDRKQELEKKSMKLECATIPSTTGFVGFSTATGQSLEISAEKLKHFSDWLADDSSAVGQEDRDHTAMGGGYCDVNNKPSTAGIIGFSTAAGQPLAVSPDKLKVFRGWLEDDGSGAAVTTDRAHAVDRKSSSAGVCGFSTAAGQSLAVNPDKLKLFGSWLDDDGNGNVSNSASALTGGYGNTYQPAAPVGFASAAGKKLKTDNAKLRHYADWLEISSVEPLGNSDVRVPCEELAFESVYCEKADSSSLTASQWREVNESVAALVQCDDGFTQMPNVLSSQSELSNAANVDESAVFKPYETALNSGTDAIDKHEHVERDEQVIEPPCSPVFGSSEDNLQNCVNIGADTRNSSQPEVLVIAADVKHEAADQLMSSSSDAVDDESLCALLPVDDSRSPVISSKHREECIPVCSTGFSAKDTIAAAADIKTVNGETVYGCCVSSPVFSDSFMDCEEVNVAADDKVSNCIDNNTELVISVTTDIPVGNSSCASASNAGLPSTAGAEHSLHTKQELTCVENPASEHKSESGRGNIGISTASGKAVEVSKEALLRSKHLLSGTDDECLCNDESREESSGLVHGFATASGKKIIVSEEALVKSSKLLLAAADSDHIEGRIAEECKFTDGFSTASGKVISVSDDAMQKSKLLFESCVESSPNANKLRESMGCQNLASVTTECSNNTAEQLTKHLKTNSGFLTASGKKVQVSEDAMLKTKQMFDNWDDDHVSSRLEYCDDLSKNSGCGSSAASGQLAVEALSKNKVSLSGCDAEVPDIRGSVDVLKVNGFSIASGKKVLVSEEALMKSRMLLDDHCFDDAKPGMEPCETPRPIAGFSTASGKKVNVSADALLKGRMLFNNVDVEMETPDHSCVKSNVGFLTASGKKIDVSDEAMLKSTMLMSNGDVVDVLMNEIKTPKTDGSFSTASGKKVFVSDEAMLKGKMLVSSCDAAVLDNAANQVTASKAGGGFSTASGKAVQVSDDAMLKSKMIFDSISMELPKGDCRQHKPVTSASGFATASGKKMVVSEDAMMKSKLLFDSHEDECLQSFAEQQLSVGKINGGFATASGRTVHVSEDALLKSKLLLDADDCNVVDACLVPSRSKEIIGEKQKLLNKADCAVKNIASCAAGMQVAGNVLQQSNCAKTASVSSERNSYQRKSASSSFACMGAQKNALSRTSADNIDRGITRRKPIVTSEDAFASDCWPRLRKPSMAACEDVLGSSYQNDTAESIGKKGSRTDSAETKTSVKPAPGQLWLLKTNTDKRSRVTLRAAANGGRPKQLSKLQLQACGVLESTLSVSAATAGHFRMSLTDYHADGTVLRLLDGGTLVPAHDGSIGREECHRALLGMRGVSGTLISDEWVFNHFKWIVWKLAALEVALPDSFAARCLTPENVMAQLKYRYDCEIDRCKRSAVRKILEKDDSSQRPMVLCCVRLVHDSSANKTSGISNKDTIVMEVTDGWYSIKAQFDAHLSAVVRRGRLNVGDKIVTYGAELHGCEEGAAPLEEAAGRAILRLNMNSTRRARWDARLGFCHCPTPPPMSFKSLVPGGGLVGCVDVIVSRTYPLLYMERTPAGVVFRNARADAMASVQCERQYQQDMERFIAKMREQMDADMQSSACDQARKRRKWTKQEVEHLTDSSDIYEAFKSAVDPELFESLLNITQRGLLWSCRRQQAEAQQQEINAVMQSRLKEAGSAPTARQVTPMLKARLLGCHALDRLGRNCAMLAVWRPTDDVSGLIVEGSRLRIYNLQVAEGSRDNATVSLTAARNTRYQPVRSDSGTLLAIFQPRLVTSLPDIDGQATEVDIVGVVIHVSDVNMNSSYSGSMRKNQTVYLADSSSHVAIIHFNSSLAELALDSVLSVGACVAGSNLRVRSTGRPGAPYVHIYANELSLFSLHSRDKHFITALHTLNIHIPDTNAFVQHMLAKLYQLRLLNNTSTPCQKADNVSPLPLVPHGSTSGSSSRSYGSARSFVTNDDNNASVCDSDTTSMGPVDASTPVGRQQVQQRAKMRRLMSYGSPSSFVSSLPSPMSTHIKQQFKTPTPLPAMHRHSLDSQEQSAGRSSTDLVHASSTDETNVSEQEFAAASAPGGVGLLAVPGNLSVNKSTMGRRGKFQAPKRLSCSDDATTTTECSQSRRTSFLKSTATSTAHVNSSTLPPVECSAQNQTCGNLNVSSSDIDDLELLQSYSTQSLSLTE